MKNLQDFSLMCGKIDDINFDTGGLSYKYFKQNSDVKKFLFGVDGIMRNTNYYSENIEKYIQMDFKICKKYKVKFGWVCYNFYHYICGTNWDAPKLDLTYKNIYKNMIDSKNKEEFASNIIKKWYKNVMNIFYFKCHLRRNSLVTCLL